jgi:hypothetical protein
MKKSGGIITAHKHTVLFLGDGKEAPVITTYLVKGFHSYPYQALFVIFGEIRRCFVSQTG